MFIEKQQHNDMASESELTSEPESPSAPRRQSLRLSRNDGNKRKPNAIENPAQGKKARRGKSTTLSTRSFPSVPDTPPPSTPDRPFTTKKRNRMTATHVRSPTSDPLFGLVSSPTISSLDEFDKGPKSVSSTSALDLSETFFEEEYSHTESILGNNIELSKNDARTLLKNLDQASEAYQELIAKVEHRVERLSQENRELQLQNQKSNQKMSQINASRRELKAKMTHLYRYLDEQNEREKELTELVADKEEKCALYQNELTELKNHVARTEFEMETMEQAMKRIKENDHMDLQKITFDYDALLAHYESEMEKWSQLLRNSTWHLEKAEKEKKEDHRAWRNEKSMLQAAFKQRIWDTELAFEEILTSVKIESNETIASLQQDMHMTYDEWSHRISSAYESHMVQMEQELRTFIVESIHDMQDQWTKLESTICRSYDASKESSLIDLFKFKQAWLHRIGSFQENMDIVNQAKAE